MKLNKKKIEYKNNLYSIFVFFSVYLFILFFLFSFYKNYIYFSYFVTLLNIHFFVLIPYFVAFVLQVR
jgi:hypothetical protein